MDTSGGGFKDRDWAAVFGAGFGDLFDAAAPGVDVAGFSWENRTTLGIGKAANPFKVFVLPGAFPLDVLSFSHALEFKSQC